MKHEILLSLFTPLTQDTHVFILCRWKWWHLWTCSFICYYYMKSSWKKCMSFEFNRHTIVTFFTYLLLLALEKNWQENITFDLKHNITWISNTLPRCTVPEWCNLHITIKCRIIITATNKVSPVSLNNICHCYFEKFNLSFTSESCNIPSITKLLKIKLVI